VTVGCQAETGVVLQSVGTMTQRAQGFWQWGSLCRIGLYVAALLCGVALWGIPALALPQGDAITDPRTLLRRALPISGNEAAGN
jgi:hypothetical protein